MSLNACTALKNLSQQHFPQNTINTTKVADRWQATLPHGGNSANLAQFWQQYQDPLLLKLIEAAQKESSSIATANSRIAQARATRTQANAALTPTVDGSVSASRSVQQPATSIGGSQQGNIGGGSGAFNNAQISAQASWELDIFGVNRGAFEASKAQENATLASWHEARVSVAAETANAYFNQRFCSTQANVLEADVISRTETLRLTNIAVKAGFSAPANSHLAEASLADARQQRTAQMAQCDLEVKALVALTAIDEATLREKLNQQDFVRLHESTNNLFTLNEIPAQVIAQRPDIYAAEADLISAAADIQTTYASSLPKVSLNGSIGWMWLSGSGFSTNGKTWSLGPISITFPIYHPGVKEATLASSEAKYEEKASIYRSKVRTAVKEVEDALVNLHSAHSRQADIAQAIQSYQASFDAMQTKVNAGFANLIDLEDQRRVLLNARTNAINNQKQQAVAWVSLYRAAGGGWDKTEKFKTEQLETGSTP